MIELRRAGHPLTAVGALLAVVACFLPWVEAETEFAKFSIVPASADIIRGSVWVVVSALGVGLVVLVMRASVTLVGCALALYFSVSMAFWLLASRVAWLLPDQLVPDDAPARLGAGGTLAMVGALLGLAGCVVVLIEDTWKVETPRLPGWTLPTAVVVAFACLGVRHVPWFRVSGGSFDWSLGFDVVPLAGDVLSFTLLACAAMAVVAVLRPRRWVSSVIVVGGLVVTSMSMLTLAFNAVVVRASDAVLSRFGHLTDVQADLDS